MPVPITVVPYDPAWAGEFSDLAAVLARALGEVALRIEHVGSTSVPGLAAKPILDIDVVIATRDDLPAVAERLAGLGYVHNGDQGVPGREAFQYADNTVPRVSAGRNGMAHHLYVCAEGNMYLLRHLGFRDYLRTQPDVASEYGHLKQALAERFRNDRDGYTEAKSDFIHAVYRAAGLPV
ncbi:MAG: GrpB family protein [Capsulimonadaceae bacterium]